MSDKTHYTKSKGPIVNKEPRDLPTQGIDAWRLVKRLCLNGETMEMNPSAVPTVNEHHLVPPPAPGTSRAKAFAKAHELTCIFWYARRNWNTPIPHCNQYF